MPMDSPLLASVRGGGRDGRSPGLATLKEAFDVTYAVHRAEEEGARRRRGGGAAGFLHNLNEEDEDEDEEDTETITRKYGTEVGRAVEERRNQQAPPQAAPPPQQQPQAYAGAGGADRRAAESQLYHGGRAGQRDQGTTKRRNGGFELDMHSATLLGRRQKRTEPSPLGRFVPQHQGDVLDVPGSPMRID
jgi:hypothetical protein